MVAVAVVAAVVAATVENHVSGAAGAVFTVEMQNTHHPRANMHRPYVCTVCETTGAPLHTPPNRAGRVHTHGGGVLFLTSLSSSEGLYGYIRYRRFRICARVSLAVLSLRCTHRRHRRRRRGRRGFSRQYANAFRRSGGWIKREKEGERKKEENEWNEGEGRRWEKMAESKQPAAPSRHCAPRVIHNTCARVILVRRMRRLFWRDVVTGASTSLHSLGAFAFFAPSPPSSIHYLFNGPRSLLRAGVLIFLSLLAGWSHHTRFAR